MVAVLLPGSSHRPPRSSAPQASQVRFVCTLAAALLVSKLAGLSAGLHLFGRLNAQIGANKGGNGRVHAVIVRSPGEADYGNPQKRA
ncbi:unnamed protein product [Protopolystoma xenopodis]|uniref:Uncharacterized protein n=1 Tax=Protopolystoma xenopodis TaxID=117903 RepID=A0A448X8B5_9PLAT|nr:unnamed protein product [Protopolystoma xenopodis]